MPRQHQKSRQYVLALEAGRLKLRIVVEGKAYEVEVDVIEEGAHDASSAIAATIQSSVMPAAGRAGSGANDDKVVRSPLAGLVVRIYAKPGQEVRANDLLMMLEAMKMETPVTAPAAGKIKSVDVAPGNAVKLDQVLIQFE